MTQPIMTIINKRVVWTRRCCGCARTFPIKHHSRKYCGGCKR